MTVINNNGAETQELALRALIQARAGRRDEAADALRSALQIIATQEFHAGGLSQEQALGIVAAVYVQTNNPREALRLVEPWGRVDCTFKAAALADIAISLAQIGYPKEGQRLLDRMGGPGLGAEAHAALAAWQAQAGDRESSAASFRRAMELAAEVAPSDRNRAVLGRIALRQAEAGLTGDAFATAGAIPDGAHYWIPRRDIARWQAAIAAAHTRAGDWVESLQTADTIPDAYWKTHALALLARAQGESGDRDAAKATVARALRAAEGIAYPSEQWRAWTDIGIAQAWAGMGADALSTISPIPGRNVYGYVTSAIIEAEAMMTRTGGESSLPRRSREAAAPAGDRRLFALVDVAAEEMEAGDRAAVLRICNQALGEPDAGGAVWALARIAVLQYRAGDRVSSGTTIERAWAASTGVDDLITIGQVQAEAGQRASAATTLQQVRRFLHMLRPDDSRLMEAQAALVRDHGLQPA